jgi:hypothetical protein
MYNPSTQVQVLTEADLGSYDIQKNNYGSFPYRIHFKKRSVFSHMRYLPTHHVEMVLIHDFNIKKRKYDTHECRTMKTKHHRSHILPALEFRQGKVNMWHYGSFIDTACKQQRQMPLIDGTIFASYMNV